MKDLEKRVLALLRRKSELSATVAKEKQMKDSTHRLKCSQPMWACGMLNSQLVTTVIRLIFPALNAMSKFWAACLCSTELASAA